MAVSYTHLYIRTNKDSARNFKIMTCAETKTAAADWQERIAHSDSVLIESIDIFKNFLAISERRHGLTAIHIINLKNNQEHFIDFGEATYTASLGYNPEYNTDSLRYNYSSLTTPASVYDYSMTTKQKELKKQQEIVGGYNAADYVAERVYATAKDGTKVPVSLVYKKGFKKDGAGPLLLYGYGSYGHSMDPSFNSNMLSLLNRGFAFAIAHIRGGQEMGRSWYENGKLLKKKNSFTDFIDCADYLVKEKYTSPAPVSYTHLDVYKRQLQIMLKHQR